MDTKDGWMANLIKAGLAEHLCSIHDDDVTRLAKNMADAYL